MLIFSVPRKDGVVLQWLQSPNPFRKKKAANAWGIGCSNSGMEKILPTPILGWSSDVGNIGKIHCYPLQTVPLCSAVPARSSCRMVLHICGRSKSLERSKGRWFGVTLRTQHDMDVNNMGSRNWLWGLIILIITIYWKNGINGILRSSESNDLMCKWECHG